MLDDEDVSLEAHAQASYVVELLAGQPRFEMPWFLSPGRPDRPAPALIKELRTGPGGLERLPGYLSTSALPSLAPGNPLGLE